MKFIRLTSLIVVLSTLLVSCAEKPSDGKYGETFEIPSSPLSANDLVKASENTGDEMVIVKGKVERVCKASHCWCSITDDQGNRYYLNVKDEAFKLPDDCEGKTVFAKGRIVSVEEQKAHAREEGLTESYVESISNPSLETVGYVFQ